MKTKIELPRTYEDLTISQYQKLSKPMPDIQLVQAMCNIPDSQIREYPIQLIEETAKFVRELLANPIPKHKAFIKIGEVTYGFIPDWSKLTTGAYIDLMQFMEYPEQNASKIMSVLFRPVLEQYGDSYTIDGYKGSNGDLFAHVSASRFHGLMVFFSNITREYENNSLRSLREQTQKTVTAMQDKHQENNRKKNSWSVTTGIISLWNWLKMILRKLRL